MLLLFWSGTQDGIGTITSVSTLLGIGVRAGVGTGVISCLSVLSGEGAINYFGVGSIAALSSLIGLADVLTPDATYLFTIAGRDGAAYAIGVQGGDVVYTVIEGGNRVEYRHIPVGREIP